MNFQTTEILIILSVVMILVVPLLIIIFLLVYKKPKPKDLKNCPFCAEPIQKEAIVCRFCNRDLS